MGRFDEYFQAEKRKVAAQRGHAVLFGTPDPEPTAKALDIGTQLGLPVPVVGAATQLFADQLAQKKATEALTGAPKLSDWLADQTNGALTKDDLANLTWWEKNLGAFGRATGRGVRRMVASSEMATAVGSGVAAADIGRTFDDILAEELRNIEPLKGSVNLYAQAVTAAHGRAKARFSRVSGMGDDDRTAMMGEAAKAAIKANAAMQFTDRMSMSPTAEAFTSGAMARAPNTPWGTLGAFWEDPAGGAAFVAETAAEFLPVMVAAAGATAATRSPAVGVGILAAGSFTAEYGAEVNDFLAERGVKLETAEDAMALLQNTDLLREAQSAGVQRGLIIAAFDAASGGIAGKTLAKSPVGDVVAQGLAQVLFGGGGEAAAQVAAGGQLNWRDIVIEGLAEMVTLPIEVGGVAGRAFIREAPKAADAGKTAEALAEIDQMAAESKLKARSPDKFKEALDSAGLGDKSLYVPADKLREYFQAKDVALDREMLEAFGIAPDDFAEMAAAGADVAIPLSVYAARISGTDDAQWFALNSTSSPDEFSVAAAEEFNARVRDLAMEAFEEADAERRAAEESRASDVQVYDGMYSQLRSAGRTPDVAEREARVWSSFWRTMAARYGDDALDLSRRFGVEVRGPATEGMPRRRGALDVAINTLRLRGDKAVKGAGLSLREWVKARGGIKGDRGDLDAMGLSDLKAKKGGQGADELGRAAIAAGYFPDLGDAENPDGTRVDEARALMDALSDDRYVPGQEPDADLVALWSEIGRRNIDLAKMSNDQIIAALQAGGLQQDPFDGEGWKDLEVDVESEDGAATLPAGQVAEIIERRLSDARALLECVNG